MMTMQTGLTSIGINRVHMEGALLEGVVQGVQGEAQVLRVPRNERARQGDRRDAHPCPAGARMQHHGDLCDAAGRVQRPQLGCWLSSGRLCLQKSAGVRSQSKVHIFRCDLGSIAKRRVRKQVFQ